MSLVRPWEAAGGMPGGSTTLISVERDTRKASGDYVAIVTGDKRTCDAADRSQGATSTSSRTGTGDSAIVVHLGSKQLRDTQQTLGVARRKVQRKGWLHVLARVTSHWRVALALLIILEVLSIVGSIYYARSVQDGRMAAATEVAKTSARALEKLLDDQKAPILYLASMVEQNPHWPTFNASFHEYAMSIYKHYPFYEIEACPYGIVGAMDFPWQNATGQDLYRFKLDFDYQKDMLDPSRWDWATNIRTIIATDIGVAGPWYGNGPLASGAFVLRYNIFLPAAQAASWDMPSNNLSTCPQDICNRPGGLTWWGWANSVFVFEDIAAGLNPLRTLGLLYTLAPTPLNAEGGTMDEPWIASSSVLPDNNTRICINVDGIGTNWYWPLCIGDPKGVNFWPSWFPALVVGLSLLSMLMSSMVLLVLRSRAQAVRLLKQQLRTNKELALAKEAAEEGQRELEEEKTRLKDLMERQHQLIALFGAGQPDSMPSLQPDGASGVGAWSKIEELRHRMASSSHLGKSGIDLVLLELLGEGSFGKVYRGTWRGTEVAIKTMVLPSYMSGNEKREKMLIMEAAISSALAHPNIVQTFTYSIDNLVENARPCTSSLLGQASMPITGLENCIVMEGTAAALGSITISAVGVTGGRSSMTPGIGGVSSMAGRTPRSTLPTIPAVGSVAAVEPASHRGVHGYEVRLVLEFCDRGCLHDALAQQAFLSPQGLNYKAILDTALDIVRAMVHLHMADVLHGDLKARNVMLKSSGADGRGVVAKIADFGLAVRIDTSQQTHMSNLFQGTLTHMAPELLLQGRMSKAADVYAFGVLLWELFTMSEPFQGVPQALLGHQVIHENKRPTFPMRPPPDFEHLVDQCWAADALQRPSFETILPRIKAMRDVLSGSTPRLMPYKVSPPASVQQQQQQQQQPHALRLKANQLLVPHNPAIGASLAGLGAIVIGDISSGGSFALKHSRTCSSLQPVAEEGVYDDREGACDKV